MRLDHLLSKETKPNKGELGCYTVGFSKKTLCTLKIAYQTQSCHVEKHEQWRAEKSKKDRIRNTDQRESGRKKADQKKVICRATRFERIEEFNFSKRKDRNVNSSARKRITSKSQFSERHTQQTMGIKAAKRREIPGQFSA